MVICCTAQETQTEAICVNLEGREMGGSFKKEGIYVYLWRIYVEV